MSLSLDSKPDLSKYNWELDIETTNDWLNSRLHNLRVISLLDMNRAVTKWHVIWHWHDLTWHWHDLTSRIWENDLTYHFMSFSVIQKFSIFSKILNEICWKLIKIDKRISTIHKNHVLLIWIWFSCWLQQGDACVNVSMCEYVSDITCAKWSYKIFVNPSLFISISNKLI